MRLALLLVTTLGCTSRYYVRPDHLAAAEQARGTGGGDVAIPALDSGRETTYLYVADVRSRLGVDQYGLQEVKAKDLRPGLRITGWIVAGLGGLLGVVGAGLYSAGDELAQVTTIVLIEGLALFVIGLPLLILGYAIDGPEAEGPSAGMPATVQ